MACCYPRTCRICGRPSSYWWSDNFRGFCSLRCRLIGIRYWMIPIFAILISAAVFSMFMVDWLFVLYLGGCSLIPVGAFLLGRKYHQENQRRYQPQQRYYTQETYRQHQYQPSQTQYQPAPLKERYSPSSNICPECKETIPANAAKCVSCGYKIREAVQVEAVEAKPIFCSSCGGKAESSDTICMICGAEL